MHNQQEEQNSESRSLGEQMQELKINSRNLEEIRARVLGEEVTKESAEAYHKLKQQQIDLNDEAHVLEVEDPRLMVHMESARRRYAAQESALARLPRLESLRTQYVQSMGKLSGLVRTLSAQCKDEAANVEVAFLQEQSLAKLSKGQKAHGFPAQVRHDIQVGEMREILDYAAQKADTVAKNYEKCVAAYTETKDAIFALRRNVEKMGQGLINLVEASENDRRLLREYLHMASETESVRKSSAPSGSYGERLLASRHLPEEGRTLPKNKKAKFNTSKDAKKTSPKGTSKDTIDAIDA